MAKPKRQSRKQPKPKINLKNLSLSPKYEEKINTMDRLEALSIKDDIYDWVKHGISPGEIAKNIQSQGHLTDVRLTDLAKVVRRLIARLTPGQILTNRLPDYTIRAIERVRAGLDETEEAGILYLTQKHVLDIVMSDLVELMSLPLNWESVKAEEIPEDKIEYYKCARAIKRNAVSEGGLPDGMPLSFYLMASDVYARMLQHMDGLRKLLKTSSEIKVDLFGSMENREEIDHEARLLEFAKKTYPGKKVVYDVLSDPKKRRRVGNVFLKIVENLNLQKAIEESPSLDLRKKKVIDSEQ